MAVQSGVCLDWVRDCGRLEKLFLGLECSATNVFPRSSVFVTIVHTRRHGQGRVCMLASVTTSRAHLPQ